MKAKPVQIQPWTLTTIDVIDLLAENTPFKCSDNGMLTKVSLLDAFGWMEGNRCNTLPHFICHIKPRKELWLGGPPTVGRRSVLTVYQIGGTK